MGAQATPQALVGILKASFPDCKITALPHDWLTRSYRRMWGLFEGQLFCVDRWKGIRLFLHKGSSEEVFFPTVADDFDFWADEWMAGRGGPQGEEFCTLSKAADIIIYNGENSIYRNTPEGCHALFLLWLAKTRLNKPSCIVNHTAHLDGIRAIMNGMVKLVFPLLDLVAVREPCSQANLKALGISNAELFPDVVFSMKPSVDFGARVDAWLSRRGLSAQSYFCLSASGLPVSMPRGKWEGEVTTLVRELKNLGFQAVLVAKDPWCLPLAEVAKRTDSAFFGPEHEYGELWRLFEGASFLVSGHYHYVIFGAMVGCPFVPLSANNHKMQGVCEFLNWSRTTPFDVTSLRSCRCEIFEEARRLRDNRSGISEGLFKRAQEMQRETLVLGTRIASVLGGAAASLTVLRSGK